MSHSDGRPLLKAEHSDHRSKLQGETHATRAHKPTWKKSTPGVIPVRHQPRNAVSCVRQFGRRAKQHHAKWRHALRRNHDRVHADANWRLDVSRNDRGQHRRRHRHRWADHRRRLDCRWRDHESGRDHERSRGHEFGRDDEGGRGHEFGRGGKHRWRFERWRHARNRRQSHERRLHRPWRGHGHRWIEASGRRDGGSCWRHHGYWW